MFEPVNMSKLFNPALQPSQEVLDYMKTVDSVELFTNGAHQFEGQYITCRYPKIQTMEYSCELPEGLFVTKKTQMGMCHTFHPLEFPESNGDSLVSTRAGSSGGLTLLMDIAQYEYAYSETGTAGVKVECYSMLLLCYS